MELTPDERAYFEWLDDLRDEGSVNMFGAAPELAEAFPELTRQQARDVLKKWMETFSERHPLTPDL